MTDIERLEALQGGLDTIRELTAERDALRIENTGLRAEIDQLAQQIHNSRKGAGK